MFDCACQNKPTNYPLRQSRNPTVCHSVGMTEFDLKTTVLFSLADINNISFITMPKQIQKKTHHNIKQLGS